MNPNWIYFPCLALMFLSFGVMIRMFLMRVAAVKDKKIDVRYFKTYDFGENPPALMTQAGRNFTNLFEVPTIFYMVCVFALITHSVDTMMIVAAWVYVILRCAHSAIHLTTNKIATRMMIYGVSWVVLLYMGIMVGVRILLGS
jgi:hypothetical protein